MSSAASTYKNHRYSIEIVARAIWLYFRFNLSLREVEEMLLERGIVVSYETIRPSQRAVPGSEPSRVPPSRRRQPLAPWLCLKCACAAMRRHWQPAASLLGRPGAARSAFDDHRALCHSSRGIHREALYRHSRSGPSVDPALRDCNHASGAPAAQLAPGQESFAC